MRFQASAASAARPASPCARLRLEKSPIRQRSILPGPSSQSLHELVVAEEDCDLANEIVGIRSAANGAPHRLFPTRLRYRIVRQLLALAIFIAKRHAIAPHAVMLDRFEIRHHFEIA